MTKKVYIFQCNRCLVTSSHVSSDPSDAPLCCGGEPMAPILIESTPSTGMGDKDRGQIEGHTQHAELSQVPPASKAA